MVSIKFSHCYIKSSKAAYFACAVIGVWTPSSRHTQPPSAPEEKPTRIHTHRHGSTNEYTNATASLPSLCGQEEHSRHIISECFSSQCDNMSAPVPVTTPHCIDIHQLCSSLGHNTTMPKIWHWKNNSPAFTCLHTPTCTRRGSHIHACVCAYMTQERVSLACCR